MAQMQLRLEDYTAMLRVGVHAHERTAPQRVRVNVTVTLNQIPARDDMEDTYNYENIIQAIKTLSETHVDLLETFAQRLAANLLSDQKITAVELELMKLDILPGCALGVRYQTGRK